MSGANDDIDSMSWAGLRDELIESRKLVASYRKLSASQRREIERLIEIRVKLSYEVADLKRLLKERGEK